MVEPGLTLRLLGDLKRFGRVRQKLIAPLVILGLTDVILGTDDGHRPALEAFEYNGGFGLGVPLASLHGRSLLCGSATVYSVQVAPVLAGSSIGQLAIVIERKPQPAFVIAFYFSPPLCRKQN